jgi:hypothetical protein
MFAAIQYTELQNYMLYKVTKFKANDYDFFLKLVSHVMVAKATQFTEFQPQMQL